MSKTKKVALCSVMSALAIVFGYIESMMSVPLAIPGVKLGFGNIAVLVCLYAINRKTAFFVMLVKVIVSGVLFSSPVMLIYSLFGGILSFFGMVVLKKYGFGILGTSVGGAVLHNVGQLTAAVAFLKSLNVFYYLPVLVISGVVTGIIVGALSHIILKRLPFLHEKTGSF